MKNLRKQIADELQKINEMIRNGENKEKINVERKKIDKMLEEYLKDI